MAKKAEYTRDSIAADIENFRVGKFSKTNMTIDFMDAYVAWFAPETIETWIAKCLSIPMVNRKIGGVDKKVKDSKAIRELFIATYFADYTDEAKEAAKKLKKEERAKKKAEKEAAKTRTDEEKLRDKFAKLTNS